MASCDVLALFTTPIHSSIKDSTSTFGGSYGRCGQNDLLHSFEGKNHLFFRLLAKEMRAQHVGLFFVSKFVGYREANASLSYMNLKIKLKSFFEKTTASMSNFTLRSFL